MKKGSNTEATRQAAVILKQSDNLLDSITNAAMVNEAKPTPNQIAILATTANKHTQISLFQNSVEKTLARKLKELHSLPLYREISNLKAKKRGVTKAAEGLCERMDGVLEAVLADYMPGEELHVKMEHINSSKQLTGAGR